MGGRKKGTPTKVTQSLLDILNAREVSLPDILLDILPTLDARDQAKVILGLMDYVYPKRKAIEMTGEGGSGIKVTIEDFTGGK